MQNGKLLVFICLAFTLCGGCSLWHDNVELLMLSTGPGPAELYANYEDVNLLQSTSADVLTSIYLPDHELLSQTKSVVAASGTNKRGHRAWFKLVAFDEDETVARRKYIFLEDERPKKLFVEPWEMAGLDCILVLDKEILDQPYANENAKRIVLLQEALVHFRDDVREVSLDNKQINVLASMVNQAFETVIVKLDSSPALARHLSDDKGLEFNHMSFDKGSIQMHEEDWCSCAVTIKIRLGSSVKMPAGALFDTTLPR
jgi:hypothetical protein